MYLIYFAQSHLDFRRQELESLAKYHDIQVDLSNYNDSPFLLINSTELDAIKLISQSVLVKAVYEVLAHGVNYDLLHENLKGHDRYPFLEYADSSFKFTMESFNTTRSPEAQKAAIDTFSHLAWRGKIDMRRPENKFTILEHWDGNLIHIYFCRFLAHGSRSLISKYDLKKRGYLGTTSMDSELSLISATQVLAGPGRVIYDPFVGTGSLLVAASARGAYSIGSDIDGRQIKGKGERNIESNFRDYGLLSLLLDCVAFDVKFSPWRQNFKVDGIIADPPYGVRAGAKTLGREKTSRFYGRTEPSLSPSGQFVHLRDDYVPPKRGYELSELADDLLDYASELLLLHARIVFWLPTVNEDFSPVDLPARSDMRLLAISTQSFGRWSRRLLTYEKISDFGERIERIKQPGHFDFRGQYYSRFS